MRVWSNTSSVSPTPNAYAKNDFYNQGYRLIGGGAIVN